MPSRSKGRQVESIDTAVCAFVSLLALFLRFVPLFASVPSFPSEKLLLPAQTNSIESSLENCCTASLGLLGQNIPNELWQTLGVEKRSGAEEEAL